MSSRGGGLGYLKEDGCVWVSVAVMSISPDYLYVTFVDIRELKIIRLIVNQLFCETVYSRFHQNHPASFSA